MPRRIPAALAASLAASFALGLSCAGAAQAQVVSDVLYTLDPADPTLPDHYHDACTLHAVPPSPGLYETRLMTVAVAGVYAVNDISAPNDGSMAIMVGALNPAAPLVNCYASVNDGQAVFLNAGLYQLTLTTLGGGPGDYGYRFNGPGAVAFGPIPPSPASVPTLSEWAMILFAALLLAGGAWTVQRRRAL